MPGRRPTFDYALDGTAQPGRLSFVNVALHEIGHGLGFVSLVNESTGANPMGKPDIFSFFTRDTSTGLLWHQMNDAERVASAKNTGRLVWDGPNVNATAPSLLTPGPVLLIDSPASVHGSYEVASAQFGPELSESGISGELVVVDDGTASPREGCKPFTNAAAVRDASRCVVRGNCNYAIKAANAQNAGATALIVVNNVPGPPMAPGGTDASITIPVVMIRQDDGALLFQTLGGSQPTPTPPPPPPNNPGPTPTRRRRRRRRRNRPTPSPAPSTPSSATRRRAPASRTGPRSVSRTTASACARAGPPAPARPATATPRASPATPATFWFFEQANVELVLKVKNACASAFNHFWFFAAGLTDVDVVIEVADTKSGRVLTYHNPQGRPFPPVQDTDAFPTCP